MRLLFVSTETRPFVGGIARCLDGWLSGLAEAGHDVTVLSLYPSQLAGELATLPQRRYREIWHEISLRTTSQLDRFVLIRKARTAAWLRIREQAIKSRVNTLLDEIKPDQIIFCVLNDVCCAALDQTKRRGLRCVGITYAAEIQPIRVFNPRWLRATFTKLDRIIAISQYTRGTLVDWGVAPDKIRIVHPALTADIVNNAGLATSSKSSMAQSWQGSNKIISLLTICRMVQRKGIDTVLHALATLRQQNINITYDIVGDGPYLPYLRQLASDLELGACVRFHGKVSDHDRETLLRACDLFILVPHEADDGDVEGFGIVYLEAGLYGKPVIGSHSGGIEDAVNEGETGLLVPPAAPGDLAEAIRTLAKDRELRDRLGRAGEAWANQHTPKVIARTLNRELFS